MEKIDMGHEHKHEHEHLHSTNKKTLKLSLAIITAFMIVEIIGGLITNSLALLADAGHMLSDSISLFIALMAFTFSSKVADYSKTYGYKRFEILAAVLNGATLIVISGYIIYQAIGRFFTPPEINSSGMLLIAFIGLLANVLVAWIMIKGADVKDNLNMRSAYLHVISDMLGSGGAIIAGLLIMFFGWMWADSVASILVAFLVLRSGYLVTKSSVHILMEGTPENVVVKDVTDKILSRKEIVSIHDLHIWTITSGLNALTCHAVVDENMTVGECEKVLNEIEKDLEEFSIRHITIQFETHLNTHDESILCTVTAVEGGSFHGHQH